MNRALEAALEALAAGRDAVLCVLFAAEGSTPRGAGGMMMVAPDGRTIGTVGGGALEQMATARGLSAYGARRSQIESYALQPGGAGDLGMVCGGSVALGILYLDGADPRALAALRRAGEAQAGAYLICRIEGALATLDVRCAADIAPYPAALAGERPIYLPGDPAYYAEPLPPACTVFLFGAGHVGQALMPLLAALDFRVSAFDDRAAIARQCPAVARYDYAAPDLCAAVTANDFIVVMTHGHSADYAVLLRALRTPATYIGCIGSRKKAAATRDRLIAAGFTDADVARIHTPIGLSIGAVTPAEIAVSVAAELIAHRAQRR